MYAARKGSALASGARGRALDRYALLDCNLLRRAACRRLRPSFGGHSLTHWLLAVLRAQATHGPAKSSGSVVLASTPAGALQRESLPLHKHCSTPAGALQREIANLRNPCCLALCARLASDAHQSCRRGKRVSERVYQSSSPSDCHGGSAAQSIVASRNARQAARPSLAQERNGTRPNSNSSRTK